MPEGVQYPDIVDKVFVHKEHGALLVMRDDRPWDGSEAHIGELAKKINLYAKYARQGQLARDFPDTVGKSVSVELWCIQHRPDPKTMAFLDRANAQLAQHSLKVSVKVIEVESPEMRSQRRKSEGKPWWRIW